MTETGLNIKSSEDGKSFVLEGYMVVFDNVDLYGTKFTKNTDFWESTTSATPPLMYDHAMDAKLGLQMIGQVTKKKTDEVGIWFEAQMDKANKFAEAIAQMVRAGKMGVSTGTSPHMMSLDGNTISSWPILEVSLTPTPAEPDTIDHLAQKRYEEAVSNLIVAAEAVKALSSKSNPADESTADDADDSTEGLAKRKLDLDLEIEHFKRSRSAVVYR